MTRVLLTGGSGFIATHVLKVLLERGYSVVVTVRSEAKANSIRSAHPEFGKDKLDSVIVKDIAVEGAFDEAVKSDPPFDVVIHTASPFHYNVTDIQKQLLDPAIIGTTGILRSIQKHAPTVKKVVITSSFAAIMNPFKGDWPEHTYSESDWNPLTPEQALENPFAGYAASKALAERAAWDFVEKEKPNFSLTTMCPPWVFGPALQEVQSFDTLNTSNQHIASFLLGKYKDEIPPTPVFLWVDVRDLAMGHVLAVEKPDAASKRFFFVAGYFTNRGIADILRKNFSHYESKLPSQEVQGGGFPAGGLYKIDNTRVKEVLGIEFTPLEQCVVDTAKSFKALGL